MVLLLVLWGVTYSHLMADLGLIMVHSGYAHMLGSCSLLMVGPLSSHVLHPQGSQPGLPWHDTIIFQKGETSVSLEAEPHKSHKVIPAHSIGRSSHKTNLYSRRRKKCLDERSRICRPQWVSQQCQGLWQRLYNLPQALLLYACKRPPVPGTGRSSSSHLIPRQMKQHRLEPHQPQSKENVWIWVAVQLRVYSNFWEPCGNIYNNKVEAVPILQLQIFTSTNSHRCSQANEDKYIHGNIVWNSKTLEQPKSLSTREWYVLSVEYYTVTNMT